MFGIDVDKLLFVGIIALVLIGPKEMPAVLRAVGQFLRKVSSVRDEVQRQFLELTKISELDAVERDLDEIGSAVKLDFANDPAIAMRGHLPGQPAEKMSGAIAGELTYLSEEMRSYLAPDASRSVDGLKCDVAPER
jgi:sec-independent protein translocase protein TatB